MATPNYAYEKRQRELAKKRKKEEKAQRRAHETGSPDALAEHPVEPGTDALPDANDAGSSTSAAA